MEPHCVVQCLYTITADHDFILDRVPGHDNIIVGAGFSGKCEHIYACVYAYRTRVHTCGYTVDLHTCACA